MKTPEIIEGQPAEARVEFSEEAFELFPTCIIHRRFSGVEGLNVRLRQQILERAATTPGVTRSNVGGWHSESDFFFWNSAEVKVLAELMRATLNSYIEQETQHLGSRPAFDIGLEGWANVASAGNYVAPHVHPRANFAAVYYVDAGDVPAEGSLSGSLEFLDPRNRVQMVGGPATDERDAFRLRPWTGSLVIFPSWMYHFVHAYQGTRPRICVAANAVARAKTGPSA